MDTYKLCAHRSSVVKKKGINHPQVDMFYHKVTKYTKFVFLF